MKYIVVWTLQRGSLDPPEQVSDEEALKIDQHEQVRKEIASQPQPWWERCG